MAEGPDRKRARTQTRTRTVQDTTWGLVELPPFVWGIIDTHEFNRLRDLQQTGALRYVYPGATHDRFSHCIGTAALASQLLTSLHRAQPELALTDREINTVIVAALCHDLGHGPHSHGFTDCMAEWHPEWRHEHQSVLMVQYLEAQHPGVLTDHVDVHSVCEYILGSREGAPGGWKWRGPAPGREFLFDIVSNVNSGMDVDKWDYLHRDSLYLGLTNHTSPSVTFQRLLSHARVVTTGSPAAKPETHLAWPAAEASNLSNLFLVRYDLHQKAYQHRVGRVIGAMLTEVLLHLKDVPVVPGGAVTVSTAHAHPETYVLMTDSVISDVMRRARVADVPRPAADLCFRIVTRDLWQVAGECYLPQAWKLNAETIKTHLEVVAGVSRDDFVVDVAYINCGKGKFDPMAKLWFFEKTEDEGALVPTKRLDYMRPMHCQRRVLRVFAKHDVHVKVLEDACEQWAAANGIDFARRKQFRHRK